MHKAQAAAFELDKARFECRAQPAHSLSFGRSLEEIDRRIRERCRGRQEIDRLRGKRAQTRADEITEARRDRQRVTGAELVLRLERACELECVERVAAGNVV